MEVEIDEVNQVAEVLIGKTTIQRWFSTEQVRGRPSYAQHLLRRCTEQEIGQVQTLFESQITNQTVTWRSRLVFATGRI